MARSSEYVGVRAHTRMVSGRMVKVSAHMRRRPSATVEEPREGWEEHKASIVWYSGKKYDFRREIEVSSWFRSDSDPGDVDDILRAELDKEVRKRVPDKTLGDVEGWAEEQTSGAGRGFSPQTADAGYKSTYATGAISEGKPTDADKFKSEYTVKKKGAKQPTKIEK